MAIVFHDCKEDIGPSLSLTTHFLSTTKNDEYRYVFFFIQFFCKQMDYIDVGKITTDM